MSDPIGEARSKALYEARKAYSAEHFRLRRGKADINSRCLIVAIDAFNKAFADLTAEEEPFDVLEDDEGDPTNPADRMYENEVMK